ncbi:MAG TPA: endonuclease/exonuclease/phosphatase family protein, partial [Chitinophagaceae bacterium]|nr:endonuclease/exonuclease/phosphatase family protein [Chitinophagaceae bacterium]
LAAVLFLMASLAPYADPRHWWLLSVSALGFGFLFILLFFFLFFWLIVKPRFVWFALIPLIIGIKGLTVFFAFRFPTSFVKQKPPGRLRVVTWNVARFTEWKRNNNRGSQTRQKMLQQLKEQNADVLCLQEFFHSTDSVYYDNLNVVMRDLGYPYYVYAWDNDGPRQFNGQAIFSRLPIVDSGLVRFPRPGLPETLIHADMLWGGDTVRVYTTHLQSVQFKKQDYESLEKIKRNDEGVIDNSKNIFAKLHRGMSVRAGQARIVREAIEQSPYPYLITGDFNDVPNSYTYFTISEGLTDAFLARGFGIGRTYSFISPTLRIDYILVTPEFTVRQFNRTVKSYSDHFMLTADLERTD